MTIQYLDDTMPDAGVQRLFQNVNKSKWETVIYYRSPKIGMMGEPYEQPDWICFSDSQGSKLGDMAIRGFMPLAYLGTVTDSKNVWGPILSHPDGPAMFPVEQILAYGWYRTENLRNEWKTMPERLRLDPKAPARLFPQLRGVEIKLYGCPNCRKRIFTDPGGLFSHLHNIHDYDPEDIFAYGREMGIDFTKMMKHREVETLTFADEAFDNPAAEEEVEDVVLDVVNARPRDARGRLLPKGLPEAPEDSN